MDQTWLSPCPGEVIELRPLLLGRLMVNLHDLPTVTHGLFRLGGSGVRFVMDIETGLR